MPSRPELLAKVPLFRELDPDDLERIAEGAHACTFERGERIFEIGEAGRSLFIITRGSVQVLHPERDADLELAQLGPGEFFGEMAILNDTPRSATARAASQVDAIVVDKSAFGDIVRDRPEVALKVLKAMSVRIRNADEQISTLSSRAVRDPLTGLLNRLAFNERLNEEIARSRRYGGCFAVVLFDMEGFDTVNEAVGSQGGDLILSWIGRMLSEHTRAADVAFRLGQDDFAVLCPWTETDVAVVAAQRLCALVAEAKPPVGDSLALTLNAGVVSCPDDAKDAVALYHGAQRALSTNKQASAEPRATPG